MKRHASILSLIKTILPITLGTIVMIVLIAWMSGMFNPKIKPGQSGLSSAEIAIDGSLPTDKVHPIVKMYFEEAVGTLKASNRTEISARVMAPINKITVRAGQKVGEGELLVELDARALETQYSQAKSGLVAANAAYNQAEIDFNRNAKLVEKKSVSQAEYDQSKSNLEVAKAKKDGAGQAVQEAEVMLSYTKIMAPRGGIIVDRLAEVGDMARPGVPLLTLYDPTSLRLEVPVQEDLAVKLKIGQKLNVHLYALKRDIEATVDEIVPQAETSSRSLLVKVALPKVEGVYEGMFGKLEIPAGQRTHLCLAEAAIQKIGQLQYVEMVQSDGHVEKRFITTGRRGMPGRIEVLSGLEAGDKVILRKEE